MFARAALACLLALLLAACGGTATAAAGDPPQAVDAAPDQVDYSCRSDSDCAVKNVGNCCGEYPACVNKDSPTFPEQVQAQCAAEGRMSVCGFPVITGCRCVEGHCENVTGAAHEVQ